MKKKSGYVILVEIKLNQLLTPWILSLFKFIYLTLRKGGLINLSAILLDKIGK